ncbi:MAG TPA: NAD(P)-binding domain-containing protein, partial [Gaiellaceae bacterium]|nr:NAD(P)-binding domain-containing protein [Gaiellaceae bacterium]
MIVGVLHPGDMGAAIGDALRAAGHDAIWASENRSDATRRRAGALRDAGTLASVAEEAEVVFSICPPHAALDVARAFRGFDGVYVDANAISPARAREVAALQPRFVDGGIVGPPPRAAGDTRLYLSGSGADDVVSLFTKSIVDARVVADASALKLVYAAWGKGTAAMLLAIQDVARHYGVAEALEAEWRESQPELFERL